MIGRVSVWLNVEGPTGSITILDDVYIKTLGYNIAPTDYITSSSMVDTGYALALADVQVVSVQE